MSAIVSNRWIILFAALLLLMVPISRDAHADEFAPDRTFDQAHAAYVAGDYDAAVKSYREMIDHGYATMEVWYNLANASFHSGKLGEAVLYYRRAWVLSPRDADVLANLNLAAQRTGAVLPASRLWDRFGQELTGAEWKIVLLAGYWAAMIALLAGCLIPAMRRMTKPVAITGLLVGFIGLAGWSYWFVSEKHPEAVVTLREQTALYEPRANATPFFALPEGSIVRIEDSFDSWIKVSSAGKSGWIAKNAAERVSPWNRAEMK